MAITTTWSVSNMTHKDSDGGVFLVYWSLTAEAKKRIEDERTAKVQGQIDRATANSNGVPW